LVIDEFQEFYNINESVYSDIQNIWDTYRKKSKMNLIVSGSVYSLMQKIFQNNKEPLFGRADKITKLAAFDLITLKEIMRDNNPNRYDEKVTLYDKMGNIENLERRGKADGANDVAEYTYDANGNLKKDYNKKIVDIRYNSLYLPDGLQFTNGNTTMYTYDATGNKLSVTHQTAVAGITIWRFVW